MSKQSDALKAAEAALKAAEAELEAVEHPEGTHGGGAAPAEPVKPSETGSVYLGHVGEPAVEGKDF